MANRDNPHGLHSLGRTMGGGMPYVEQLSKAVGYGTAIFIGDAVNRVSGGSIEASATPGTTYYSGVALNYGALSTATDHLVITSPAALYEAQDNAVSAGVTAAQLGLNANLVLGAGSAVTQISGHEINETGIDVTNTLDVHLLRLYDAPDNAHGVNARIEIVFNKHRMDQLTVGV